jgi:cell wall-associated NlpC family hydrolase
MSERGRPGASLVTFIVTGALAVVVVALTGTVMAILGSEIACIGGGGSAAAAPATRAAERDIPLRLLRIYQAAGRRIDIDWSFVAAIGEQECGEGNCAGVNGSGCAGPMQIAYVRESPCSPGPGPTIWERYRVDGDGDGAADIDNRADAVFTAARILREVLGAPPAGGSYAAYREAACGYYGACADGVANYAEEVMARAVSYGFGGKGAPPPSSAAAAEPVASGVSACGSSSGSAASGNEIVRIARSQLGTSESPPGSNCNPYGPCVEWCSLFVAWVWRQAGVEMEGSTATYAYSGTVYEWAEAHEGGGLPGATAPGEPPFSVPEPNGARVLPPTATPAPGDAVLYGTGPTDSDHIGIVERVFADGRLLTIDGNFGNRVARSGPFLPSQAVGYGMPAPIFGYAHPPASGDGADG